MKRSTKKASGQLTLTLYPESSPRLDEPRREELLQVLADLLLEALGVEAGNQIGKEEDNELEDHA